MLYQNRLYSGNSSLQSPSTRKSEFYVCVQSGLFIGLENLTVIFMNNYDNKSKSEEKEFLLHAQ